MSDILPVAASLISELNIETEEENVGQRYENLISEESKPNPEPEIKGLDVVIKCIISPSSKTVS